jgi:hypothetical protein
LNIREKINDRLNDLEARMELQEHLNAPSLLMEKLESVSKFWHVLTEDEREIIIAIRLAIRSLSIWR